MRAFGGSASARAQHASNATPDPVPAVEQSAVPNRIGTRANPVSAKNEAKMRQRQTMQ